MLTGPILFQPPTTTATYVLSLTVYAHPAPQGSKKYIRHYLHKKTHKMVPLLLEQVEGVKPWREAVAYETHKAIRAHNASGALITGATGVWICFSLPRPKNEPKKRRTLPDRKPDVDKLLRATLDGLSTPTPFGDCLWENDSRTTDVLGLYKRYAGDPDGLDEPGALIHIYSISPH